MLAVATSQLVLDIVSASAATAVLFLLIKMARESFSLGQQHTFVYCPHCNNELAGDKHTVCVDQAQWRQAGVDPDDLVEDWHNRLGAPDVRLHEYMGLSWNEYGLWAEYPPVNGFEVIYKCGNCSGCSAWDFDHFPAPILTRSRAAKNFDNISNRVEVNENTFG